MCGRYSLIDPNEAMRRLFGYDGPELDLRPRYNIAPTQEVAAVRLGSTGGYALARLRWGLLPAWAKDKAMAASLINARAETVAEKPSFRQALTKRRCLVPADGYYEWTGPAGAKQPYRLGFADGRPFALAGLWESWRDPAAPKDAPALETVALITTPAAGAAATIHDRMPAILAPADYRIWLDAAGHPPAKILPLLAPWSGDAMVARPVSKRVNNARNDDAGCLEAA